MKRYIILLLCIPFLLSGCLRNLEKEGIKNETIFKGRVIDAQNKPLNGIMVRITNGSLIYNSVTTDKDGIFQITVDFSKIDKAYYIQVGEAGSILKRSSLKGFGQDVYDYGDIPFVNINLPEIETIEITDMTPNSFTCQCYVQSEGGAKVTERGACWSTNIPTVEDNKVRSGSGAGSYSCIINNAYFDFSNTIYYVCAYAINEYGVVYGKPIEITPAIYAEFMKKKYPIVETIKLADMTSTSLTCQCNVKSEGGAKVTERGVCWSTNIPTIDDNKEKSGAGVGTYSCIINNANFDFSNTIYYMCAYAINEYGVVYGEVIEITPAKYAEFMKKKYPVVEIIELADVTINSFTCQCEVKSQGGAMVTERGMCWSTSVPTIKDNIIKCGVGIGVYSCNISNDLFDFSTMTIYARAYAINEFGEAYSELIEINSEKLNEFMKIKLPTVETVGLTAMTSNSFTCKCNVVSQGKAIVTERGICWSTNIPTIQDNKVKFGGGEGVYACTVTNLNFSSTTYYARAYAINEYGVSYGEPVEVNSSRMAYFSLPTMEFGGYTYHIHPDMGGMQWQQGFDACENLVAYGFDDWFMPNKEEMLAIANLNDILDKSIIYWTNLNNNYEPFYLKYSNNSWNAASYDNYYYRVYHVIPVRRDR